MPKFIVTFIIVLLLGLPQLGSAQAVNPCDGVQQITPRILDAQQQPIDPTPRIQVAFDNYKNYVSGNMYKLCFNGEVQYSISQTLSFNVRADKPVLIYGLNLHAIDGLAVPLISIGSSAAQVTLQNIHISNAMQGMTLAGKYHRILDSDIAGIRDGGAGTGVDLRAFMSEIQNTHVHGFDIQTILAEYGAIVSANSEFNDGIQCLVIQGKAAKVKGSDIHHCSDVGISIAAEETLIGAASAETYAADKNTINHNGVGIFISQGVKNKFAYNSVYLNRREDQNGYSVDDGLSMAPDLLVQLERPELLLEEVDGVYYGLQCSQDEATHEVTARWIQVQNAKGGELIIYQRDQDSLQGKDFLLSCTVQTDGQCPIVFPAELNIAANVCGSDQIIAIALLTNENYSSIYNSNTFILDKAKIATAPSIGEEGGTIILTPMAENGDGAAEQPAVIAPGAGDSGSGNNIFVADSGPSGDGLPDEIFTDPGVEQKDKKDSTAAFSGPSETTPGPLAGGASGGCSLQHTHQSSPSILQYLLILAVVAWWNKQRKKARQVVY